MLKYFLSLFLFIATALGHAETKSHFAFTGQQVMITMSSHNLLGQFDNGPELLFRDLNLPIQKSFIGDGKVLTDSQNQMTLVVADRGNHRYDVSIVIKLGSNTQIDIANKYAEARFTGVAGQLLYSAFNSTNSKYEFINQEGNLKIVAEPEYFLLTFQ